MPRREFMHAICAAGASLFAASPALAETPGDIKKREMTQQLRDPYSGTRDQGRVPFADEFAPLSADERRSRAEFAAKASRETRVAPKVSKLSGPAYGGRAKATDEFTLEFDPDQPAGLQLKDLRVGFEYGTTEGTSRVLVLGVTPGGQAETLSKGKIAKDAIVVAVDGENVERETAQQVQRRLAKARADGRPARVTFKNPLTFNEKLRESAEPVATTIAPATPTSEAQVLGVKKITVPGDCTRRAANGDLMEIRYAGRLADGTIFDGMRLADRFGDDSIQFVLGRQPAGQFPPSWDVGLVGMCVEERREIDVPPVLGFGPKGLVKKGVQLVPPDARIIYDVELVALNALATH